MKKTCVPQFSSQHCLQQLGYGSNLGVLQHTNRNKNRGTYDSAIKKNVFESLLMRWMKLEPIIQSEVCQKEKHQQSILTNIYGNQKDGNYDHICEVPKDTDIKKRLLDSVGEGQGEMI